MSYYGSRIGVVYKDRVWADRWLEDFRDTVDEAAILRIVHRSTDYFFIELRDYTTIRAMNIDIAPRGYKFNRLIAQPSLKHDDRMNEFRMCLVDDIYYDDNFE